MNPSSEPGSPNISGSSTSDSETESPFTSHLSPRGTRSGPAWQIPGSHILSGSGSPDFPAHGKRRNPPGPASAVSRDAKSRRREEGPGGGRRAPHHGRGAGNSGWQGDGGSKKDDLVDQQIVDQLRIQFGDPFDDSDVKTQHS